MLSWTAFTPQNVDEAWVPERTPTVYWCPYEGKPWVAESRVREAGFTTSLNMRGSLDDQVALRIATWTCFADQPRSTALNTCHEVMTLVHTGFRLYCDVRRTPFISRRHAMKLKQIESPVHFLGTNMPNTRLVSLSLANKVRIVQMNLWEFSFLVYCGIGCASSHVQPSLITVREVETS